MTYWVGLHYVIVVFPGNTNSLLDALLKVNTKKLYSLVKHSKHYSSGIASLICVYVHASIQIAVSFLIIFQRSAIFVLVLESLD